MFFIYHNRYYEKIGKNEPVDITDDLPFDIPDSWEWIRLSNTSFIYNGNSINEDEKQKKYTNVLEGYNYIATKDVSFDRKINYNNGIRIPFNTQFRVAPNGNVLMCIEGGSAGRKIAILNEDVCFGNKLACFHNYYNISKYLFCYLQSPAFSQIFKGEISGIIGGVSINTLKSLFLPLPPLAEQQRIVEKIESMEPYLAQYDKIEKQLTKLEGEIKDKLKKSILQYAIQGKLVKQDPNDEPASILLERIKAEKEQLIKEGKIKRDKNESFIYKGDDKNYYENINGKVVNITEEIPFEIPDNWNWCRLKEICSKIVDGNHNPPKGQDKLTDYKMLSSQNIGDNCLLNMTSVRYLTLEQFIIENKRTNIENNDILFTSVGTLGRSCIYTGPLNISFQRSVSVIHTLTNPNYVKIYFDNPLFQYFIICSASGTAQKGFYLNQLSNSLICLPNTNLQEKIIVKVGQLLNVIYQS